MNFLGIKKMFSFADIKIINFFIYIRKMNNLAIIGYGKMGKAIEKLACNYGFEVCSIIDTALNNKITPQHLNNADVAVEFTQPDSAANNIMTLFDAGINVVSGTTGWNAEYQKVADYCKKLGSGFFYASNFSVGMNIVFQLNKQLATMLDKVEGYKVSISETHHTQKLDKPSGTAVTLANDFLNHSKKYSKWKLEPTNIKDGFLPIFSKREGNVTGLHIVNAKSEYDLITLQHEAFNRNGFTTGVLMACNFILNKKGIYNMNNLLGLE